MMTNPIGKTDLVTALTELINEYSLENASNTPDFILAQYLLDCLNAYNKAVQDRAVWYNRIDVPGGEIVTFKRK